MRVKRFIIKSKQKRKCENLFFLMRIEKRSVSEEEEEVLKLFINPKQKNCKPESGRRSARMRFIQTERV